MRTVFVALLGLLAGCASGPRNDQLPLDEHLAKLGLRQGETVQAISRYDIGGWEYLDKRHISVGRAPGRRYLVEFTRPCDRLGFSSIIGFSSTVGQLTRMDHITVTDMGDIPQTCQIESLYRLEKVEKKVP